MKLRDLYYWFRSGGRPEAARLCRWSAQAKRITRVGAGLRSAGDAELLRLSHELRWEAQSGTPLRRLLPTAYAVVREASRRQLGMEHFRVQLLAGIALFEGGLAEMQTGEGKTLTALLPVYLRALAGRGCHVVTANDYLAKRDAEFAESVLQSLGMSIGCIQPGLDDDTRRRMYHCDVTYGTEKEFGFDFLRDRLKLDSRTVSGDDVRRIADRALHAQRLALLGEPSETARSPAPVQRGHYFALVDEADAVLIDQAQTPLLLAVAERADHRWRSLYRWSDETAGRLQVQQDFAFDPAKRTARLTLSGCQKVIVGNKPQGLRTFDAERVFRQVERSLAARLGFARDRDYVVAENEVAIVDESTGRILDGRKWQDGLQQAVETKERLPLSDQTHSSARITVQAYFRTYAHLAGMTGTAVSVRREVKRVFGLPVSSIPTHRPCVRRAARPRIFATQAAKIAALVVEVERLQAAGRAVLIGTPSVRASEAVGAALRARGIEHELLHARRHDREAEIIAQAGQAGRVTLATNMAGRGTDIALSADVRATGGLHVIATEMHSSARIDRQLIGRCARQGDPGSYQQFMSLEDELLRTLDAQALARLRRRARAGLQGELSARWLPVFQKIQRRLERRQYQQRLKMLKHEQRAHGKNRKMGLDPFLELCDTSES